MRVNFSELQVGFILAYIAVPYWFGRLVPLEALMIGFPYQGIGDHK